MISRVPIKTEKTFAYHVAGGRCSGSCICQSTGSVSSHEVTSGSRVGTPMDPYVGHNMRGDFCSFVGGTVGAVRDMMSQRG